MKKIRFAIAVLICKILIVVSKLTGAGGSSAPGKFALRFYPDALRYASEKIKGKIIVTCGTNGKTTSNNLINNIMLQSGRKTICNSLGANMLPGIVTAFLSEFSIFGKTSATDAVLEIDEATTVRAFDHFTPDIVHITNLFRDQLDRYGEIDSTANMLVNALKKAPESLLVINGDDPVCAMIAKKSKNKAVAYGISENCGYASDDVKEGRFCRFCGSELEYDYYHYSQLGDYKCPGCDFKRPEIKYSAVNVDVRNGIKFEINGSLEVKNGYRGFYNIYNILSGYSVCSEAGVDTTCFNKMLTAFRPQIGRMEEFYLGKKVILNLSKNPAGFNQGIHTVVSDVATKDVIIGVNDNLSDGIDVSWLWDVEFESLADEKVGSIGVIGMRKDDINLRFKYAETGKPVMLYDDVRKAVLKLLSSESEVLYILVNYTVVFEVQKILKAMEKEYVNKGEI